MVPSCLNNHIGNGGIRRRDVLEIVLAKKIEKKDSHSIGSPYPYIFICLSAQSRHTLAVPMPNVSKCNRRLRWND